MIIKNSREKNIPKLRREISENFRKNYFNKQKCGNFSEKVEKFSESFEKIFKKFKNSWKIWTKFYANFEEWKLERNFSGKSEKYTWKLKILWSIHEFIWMPVISAEFLLLPKMKSCRDEVSESVFKIISIFLRLLCFQTLPRMIINKISARTQDFFKALFKKNT